MFLDMNKIKDYMHVNDYCDAVLTAINKDLWNSDWNVAAETPCKTGDIMLMIQKICKSQDGEIRRKYARGRTYEDNTQKQ